MQVLCTVKCRDEKIQLILGTLDWITMKIKLLKFIYQSNVLLLYVFRCELRLQRAMYPNSGYSSETGGIMENLRISTNNIKVIINFSVV